ncbi:MAG: low molecular weight phosphotyrosine protein phosphatase [Planctomycetes bacterium]|nr:low molecular weight phosphotyrosine protein phosphatase [Planctomycetota bacterium]
MTELYRILCVCTGNICRSPMAEGFIAHMASAHGLDHVHVTSAGTHAPEGSPASTHAVKALADKGVDIRDHRAAFLDHNAVHEADLVLVMEPDHLVRILSLWPEEAGGKVKLMMEFHEKRPCRDGVPDPIGADPDYYRSVASLIEDCCRGVIAHLIRVRP